MALIDKLTEDLKIAMKARDQVRLDTLRAVLTEMRNMSIAQKGEGGSGVLGEADEIAVLSRARKQRDESIIAFNNGNRPDLASVEEAQLAVLLEYLPKQLTPDEVKAIIAGVITELGATTRKDMGKVMGKLMPHVKGKFPGDQVKPLVESMLLP